MNTNVGMVYDWMESGKTPDFQEFFQLPKKSSRAKRAKSVGIPYVWFIVVERNPTVINNVYTLFSIVCD